MPKFRPSDWLPWRWRVFGPILPFDLLTSSRRVRWYVLRFLLAGLMFFVFWVAAERFDHDQAWGGRSREAAKAEFAQNFYMSFASIHLTAALLLATAFLGGAIADERRRRILEFMFATDLTNREIILGKFASRTFMIAVLLSGSIPILACTMLFGGVSVDWIAQLAVLTISTLVCFGGISVWVSTTIARPRDAVVRSIMLTLLLVAAVPFIQLFSWRWGWLPTWLEYVGALNPYRILYHQLYSTGAGGGYVWDLTLEAFAIQSGVGIAALAWAVLTVRRTIVRTPGEVESKKGILRPRRFFRPTLGNWPPIFWKEAFGEPAVKTRGIVGRLIAAFIFLTMNVGIVGTWLYAIWEFEGRREAAMMSMGVLACMTSIFALLLIATRAASTVTTEREADTWTTLIAGPITSRDIVGGKVLGAVVGFWHLLIPFTLCWALAAIFDPAEALIRSLSMFAVCMLLCFVNANIGFYFSMRSKSSSAATVKTVIAVLTLAGGYMFPLALFNLNPDHGIGVLSEFFLVCFPAFAEWSPRHNPERVMWRTFIIGLVVHSSIAVVLYAYIRSTFDSSVGRMEATTYPPYAPPGTASATASGGPQREVDHGVPPIVHVGGESERP